MSRYTFNGGEPRHKVVVGWDNPLETFFLQVWDEQRAAAALENLDPSEDGRTRKEGDKEPEPVFCVGMKTGEVPTVEALRVLVGPFGEIPATIFVQLQEDVGRRERPTALQLRVRK